MPAQSSKMRGIRDAVMAATGTWLQASGWNIPLRWEWSLLSKLKAENLAESVELYMSPGPVAVGLATRHRIGRDIALQVTAVAKLPAGRAEEDDELIDSVVRLREEFEEWVGGQSRGGSLGSVWHPIEDMKFDSFQTASAVEQPIIETLMHERKIYGTFCLPTWSTD